jgi:hypothetical protein
MATPSPSRDLIRYITWEATQLSGALTKIRLIKFLYLADVYLFGLAERRATSYRWRFYHYGPWALDAQQDIEDSAQAGAIDAERRAREDDVGEMTLYAARGPRPDLERAFGLGFETQLKDSIRTWVRRPLNEFLDYVYFDTPPMREARRGDYLRFDREIFAQERALATRPLPRHSSRDAQKAWRAFLNNARRDTSRVSVPRDAVVDDAFRAAVDRLDAEDFIPRPLDARVDATPDELT